MGFKSFLLLFIASSAPISRQYFCRPSFIPAFNCTGICKFKVAGLNRLCGVLILHETLLNGLVSD